MNLLCLLTGHTLTSILNDGTTIMEIYDSLIEELDLDIALSYKYSSAIKDMIYGVKQKYLNKYKGSTILHNYICERCGKELNYASKIQKQMREEMEHAIFRAQGNFHPEESGDE
jgi:hypothetical protein